MNVEPGCPPCVLLQETLDLGFPLPNSHGLLLFGLKMKWAASKLEAAQIVRLSEAGSAGDLDDVLGGRALVALDHVELHAVTLGQRLEAVALDGRVMDEAVLLPVIPGEETEPFAVVEPLHFPGNA